MSRDIIVRGMTATAADTRCTDPACPRLACTGDCHAPVSCSDCGRELTAEEELEERAATRPQCFACISKAWEETERKIRARHCLVPPPPDTIPAPPCGVWGEEPGTDVDREVA